MLYWLIFLPLWYVSFMLIKSEKYGNFFIKDH